MDIIIVGCGKIGYNIAKALSKEETSVVIIDIKEPTYQKQQHIDALFLKGNGLSPKVLLEAGVAEADLIICVTANDETNILCCLTASKLGVKRTVARVRDPEYALELNEFRNYFGIDVIINPEQQAALEISRLLRFPVVNGIDTFAGGKVEFVTFRAVGDEFFIGKKLAESFYNKQSSVLVGMVMRGEEAHIPSGDFIPQENDIIGIIGRPGEVSRFFSALKKTTTKVKSAILVGGGKITRYLVKDLLQHKRMQLKIIENNYEKCLELDELFGDKVTIIHGDGANNDLLDAENLAETEAAICLTDKDEDNVLVGLYAKFCNVPKVIIKNNHVNDNLVRNLHLDSVVCPKNITTDQILRYVRGLKNAYTMAEIKTLHKIISSPQNDVDALEFYIASPTEFTGVPLKLLKIKSGVLIACIVRKNKIIIPSGETTLLVGDNIVVIAKNRSLMQLSDITEK